MDAIPIELSHYIFSFCNEKTKCILALTNKNYFFIYLNYLKNEKEIEIDWIDPINLIKYQLRITYFQNKIFFELGYFEKKDFIEFKFGSLESILKVTESNEILLFFFLRSIYLRYFNNRYVSINFIKS